MNFYTTQMRSGTAAIAGLLLALALTLSACGDEQTAARGVESAAKPMATEATRPAVSPADSTPATARADGHELAAQRQCRRSLGEFLDAIESLTNTVAVGLDYDGYLSAVNRVRATYAEVEAERLSLLCLARAAGPAEAALNSYIAAANVWGECLADACDLGEVEPKLQRQWARASSLLGKAQAGLRALGSS
jgi:hypothetical protein